MQNKISHKSFFWSMGTTSFRTVDFNKTIELQLKLLHDFWLLPENRAESWTANSALQSRYYDFMHTHGFLTGDAANKPKDAREKTSGLSDIGLLDAARRLTPAGAALLEIAESGDFSCDPFFGIPRDSRVYLAQLLKTSCTVGTGCVRPFILLLYLLTQAKSLSMEQFTYLLPLCTDRQSTELILQGILRKTESTDAIIIERLMAQENYQSALSLLLQSPVTEELLCEIGMNRKSREYDRPYFLLYQHLYAAYLGHEPAALSRAFGQLKHIKIGALWKKYLFCTLSLTEIQKKGAACLRPTLFDGVQTEAQFKTAFFKVMHLLKAKATLLDYRDLNRRYFKTADILLFEDDTVKLALLPGYFFTAKMPQLYAQAFAPSPLLPENCPLESICPALAPDESVVIAGVNRDFGSHVTSLQAAGQILEDERYARLHRLIEARFTREKLLQLLQWFEAREDAKIQQAVTDNADVPTIFEYVLGILWYKISGCRGKILSYMQLSLDADLLPKTHAAGGEADIVYEYEATADYPAHTLLLEATLADRGNQRRMEMEPVSRHLGRHLIARPNPYSYCVFATPHLDYNVLTDFRYRKSMPYYIEQDERQCVKGMKIIPLSTALLKSILAGGRTYNQLYGLFEAAYRAELETLPPPAWYKKYLADRI